MYPDFELFTCQYEMPWRNPGMHHTSSHQEHVENDSVCKHGHSPRTGGLKLLTHLMWLPESHEQYYFHCPFPNCARDAFYLRHWRGFTLKSHIHKPSCPAALNSSSRWQEKLKKKNWPRGAVFFPSFWARYNPMGISFKNSEDNKYAWLHLTGSISLEGPLWMCV